MYSRLALRKRHAMRCSYCKGKLKNAVCDELITCLKCHRIWWLKTPSPHKD